MNPIPQTINFYRIIQFYLFECPVRTRHPIPKKDRDPNDSQAKYKYSFKAVSKRGITFEDRGLDGARLNSLRYAMMRMTNVELIALKATDDIENAVSKQDIQSEYVIIKRNEQSVSITEGFFYCIRNALAHGGFDTDGEVYYLRNEAKGEVKGVARIKESSLLAWIDLVNMDLKEIKQAGKTKKGSHE